MMNLISRINQIFRHVEIAARFAVKIDNKILLILGMTYM